MQHDLKCDSTPYQDLWVGDKTCEVRKDDRPFTVGDYLMLYEQTEEGPTGARMLVEITHIQRGYGLPPDIVVLSVHKYHYWYNDDSSATMF